MEIRNLSPDDLNAAYRLCPIMDSELAAACFISSEDLCFGAFEKKKCTGCLFSQISGNTCTIQYFYTLPGKYSHLVSVQLINTLDQALAEKKIYHISIDIQAADTDTITFFMSRGFVHDERYVHLYKKCKTGII